MGVKLVGMEIIVFRVQGAKGATLKAENVNATAPILDNIALKSAVINAIGNRVMTLDFVIMDAIRDILEMSVTSHATHVRLDVIEPLENVLGTVLSECMDFPVTEIAINIVEMGAIRFRVFAMNASAGKWERFATSAAAMIVFMDVIKEQEVVQIHLKGKMMALEIRPQRRFLTRVPTINS